MDEVVDALQDVKGEVEGVKYAVQRVETAINDKWSSVTVVAVVLIGAFLWSLPGKAWYSKWRIGLEYGVGSDKVYKQPQPHDYNFLASPLGEKYCHYERTVSTLRWARSTTGMPISSLDDGKTWTVFTPEANTVIPVSDTVQEVYVRWDKKDDE